MSGAIGTQIAMMRQNVALSMIKQNAQAERVMVGVLEQSADNIKALNGRGSALNIRV
ncbi:MAG: hypothetical protein L6Q57_01095 [Alphaproteobacteria bacterium]|nr:hypothetical protein [Alphaproteobacteria bacterium]